MPVAGTAVRSAKTVVLGGVGGDAHSVGLVILHRVLHRAGFRVRYVGTQNSVTGLCLAALDADAVLVSNMDGHARYYLTGLRAVRAELNCAAAHWYLGGNPSTTDDEQSLVTLFDLGFTRVFPGYVEPAEVVRMLDADLNTVPGAPPIGSPRPPAPRRAATAPPRQAPAEERAEVLAQWHTGAAAAEWRANAATLADRMSLSLAQRRAEETGRILVQPRAGVAGIAEQRELFHRLRLAGADVLSFQIDSLTRNNLYSDVELALKDMATSQGRAADLNGFPAVNHGVAALREISREFRSVPLQVRHSTRDPRLLAEISFAGGITGFEGGPICYNLPYYRDYPPVESVERWRYVDTLTGRYHVEHGTVIDREFFGVLTASLVPPCIAIAVNVLEALLAAEHGVRSVSLGYAEQGNRVQDIAAVNVLRRLGRRYLAERSSSDVAVYTVFHQYMNAFPVDAGKSRQLLRGSAGTAMLSGATRMLTKTSVEARRIPDALANTDALGLVRRALAEAGNPAEDVPAAAIDAEEELITAEVCSIVDHCLEAGAGDVGAAIVSGVEAGYLDVPFSPSVWNAGLLMSVRDSSGAVRLAEPGRLPLPAQVLDRHRELVADRLRAERRPVEELLEADVLRVVRGDFDSWPLQDWARRANVPVPVPGSGGKVR